MVTVCGLEAHTQIPAANATQQALRLSPVSPACSGYTQHMGRAHSSSACVSRTHFIADNSVPEALCCIFDNLVLALRQVDGEAIGPDTAALHGGGADAAGAQIYPK